MRKVKGKVEFQTSPGWVQPKGSQKIPPHGTISDVSRKSTLKDVEMNILLHKYTINPILGIKIQPNSNKNTTPSSVAAGAQNFPLRIIRHT